MTTAQIFERSVTINNSPIQDYTRPTVIRKITLTCRTTEQVSGRIVISKLTCLKNKENEQSEITSTWSCDKHKFIKASILDGGGERKCIYCFVTMSTEFYLSSPKQLHLCTSFVISMPPLNTYRKILKISPGAYVFQRPFGGAYFWRGLSMEGNLCFKINWASLVVGRKLTIFALFYLVLNLREISKYKSPRGL